MPEKTTEELRREIIAAIPSGVPSGVVAKPLRESILDLLDSNPNKLDDPKADQAHTHPIGDIINLQELLDDKQSRLEQGRPFGYPNLDSTGKVPLSQLPPIGGGGGDGTVTLEALSLYGNPAIDSQTGQSLPAPNSDQSISLAVGFNSSQPGALRGVSLSRVFYYGVLTGDSLTTTFSFRHDLGTRILQVRVFLTDALNRLIPIEVDQLLDTRNSFSLIFGQPPSPQEAFTVLAIGLQDMSPGDANKGPYFNVPV